MSYSYMAQQQQKNQLVIHTTKWMNLTIMLNKRHTKGVHNKLYSFYNCNPCKNSKFIDSDRGQNSSYPRAGELTGNWHKRTLWHDDSFLLLISGVCRGLCTLFKFSILYISYAHTPSYFPLIKKIGGKSNMWPWTSSFIFLSFSPVRVTCGQCAINDSLFSIKYF